MACIITVATILYTGGTGFAALVAVGKLALQVLIGVASTVALSAVMALAKGKSVPDAMLSGLADGVFWGGVFAFVTAGVNAVKAGVRAVKNAKPAGSTQTGSQPKSTVNNINDIKDINYSDLPADVKSSYDAYSKNGWKGNVKGQTTNAGGKWLNSHGQLPPVDKLGNQLTYREFDVAMTMPRTASRFVVSNQMTVYYTPDHYITFFKIIGG